MSRMPSWSWRPSVLLALLFGVGPSCAPRCDQTLEDLELCAALDEAGVPFETAPGEGLVAMYCESADLGECTEDSLRYYQEYSILLVLTCDEACGTDYAAGGRTGASNSACRDAAYRVSCWNWPKM